MFRSSTQVELCFIWCRYGSTHSSVRGYPVFPDTICWKDCPFPHWMALRYFLKLLWPHVQVLFLCSVLQCAVCLSLRGICLTQGHFSLSDDRWLCARPVLCLGSVRTPGWDAQATSRPLSCVKVFAFSQGSRWQPETTSPKANSYPQKTAQMCSQILEVCAVLLLLVLAQSVYSISTCQDTSESSSLLGLG